ncbi:MAG: phospho-N-acetylmuramoyl-pentapeptide-transferase [Clostridia bacterium]|nr:phospho-N-acetylmuramoyl-pentapeptide-transferase [Clostridia bacterium]
MWINACITSFIIAAICEPFLIPFLRKLKFGQTILEDGPSWHEKKQGTPTMGGIGFILSTVVAALVFVHNMRGGAIILCGVLFGLIGFIDDYIKVVKKQNKGFSPSQKFTAQTLVSLGYAVFLYTVFGQTEIKIPFTDFMLNLGWLYIPFVMLVLLATSNSANLTDGLDGLASGVGSIVALFFAVACAILKGHGDASIIAGALAGGLLGFLIYNAYPAKVFMGDTGSLFIGGMVAAVAISAGLELFLIISAFVFLFEALSVIIQVAVFKKTKKRVFKMAPVHHHFEMCGWKETKVVTVFCIITLMLCAISYFAL